MSARKAVAQWWWPETRRAWFQLPRSERNRIRRGAWFSSSARVRGNKTRPRRDMFDRMLATAKRRIARGQPVIPCGGFVEVWDQTVGCGRCMGEAWTRSLEDFNLLHPIEITP